MMAAGRRRDGFQANRISVTSVIFIGGLCGERPAIETGRTSISV
jgi:hypothetical protein